MANLDTQEKRRSAVAISHYAMGPAINPQSAQPLQWRTGVGYGTRFETTAAPIGNVPISDIQPLLHRTQDGDQVIIDASTRYMFYNDTTGSISWRKTVDAGATWSSATEMESGRDLYKWRLWYDRWTSGDTGNTVHFIYFDRVDDKVKYRAFDTVSETFATAVDIETCQGTGAFTSENSYPFGQIGFAKTRGGNLVIRYFYSDDAAVRFASTRKSTDDGATWSAINSIFANIEDLFIIFPGNETDSNDVWFLVLEDGTDRILFYTYDDSGNSYDGGAIVDSDFAFDPDYYNLHGSIWHSTGRLALSFISGFEGTVDVRFYDIGGTGDIVARTDILTNTSEAGQCAVTINQQNDDVYCHYLRGTEWEQLVHAYYKKTSDSGVTWGSEVQVTAGSEDDYRALFGGVSIGVDGGVVGAIVANNDLDILQANPTANVSIPASAVGLSGVQADAGAVFVEYQVPLTGVQADTGAVSSVQSFTITGVQADVGAVVALQTLFRTLSGIQADTGQIVTALFIVLTQITIINNTPIEVTVINYSPIQVTAINAAPVQVSVSNETPVQVTVINEAPAQVTLNA